ncbi:cyclodeaminase/cyclohydrolase family protein [Clostridium sp.]
MKLSELQVKEFVDLLASEAAAPGGGSAAALEGALGVALAAMVCSLTVGKKKYEEKRLLIESSLERILDIKDSYIDVMVRDTEGFNNLSRAFSLPKNTEEEKEMRSVAIQDGLKACTTTPMEMMELALESLKVIEKLVGNTNNSAASDLGCAALGVKAAVQGAWLNVKINLVGIKEQSFVKEYQEKGEQILRKTIPLADDIYSMVLNSL